ncbi:MAG: LutB/LldF family L-lactate oxidation iron-sulfur protein [Caldilineaceae bacterium]
MQIQSNNFVPAAAIAIANKDQRNAVTTGTGTAYNRRLAAMFAASRAHGEAMRQQAAAAKRRALNNLPALLERAEANMQANGMTVLWAIDAAEVNRLVLEIAQQHNVQTVAKSKSMVTEEVGLNDALEEHGIRVVETDLGEYILQLNQEPPSHIVTPVIHKSKESIRDIFEREIGMPPTDSADEMARFARLKLRQDFLAADMGVSGGNFMIAETGTICLVTNEGNARMVTSLPRVHVAVVGIEKIVETVEDYATLTQVLPRSATGQNLTVYTHMVNGPRRAHEDDGPEHVYVILVDNGRSRIYNTAYAEALACIRCGACLNACPVYQSTGGHAYGWVYPGPIGAVVSPLLVGLKNAKPLPYASSLCGNCKQVCPVDIDIPRMLLDLRHDLVEQGNSEGEWMLGMRAWAMGNSSPTLYAMGGKLAAWATRTLPLANLPGPLQGWTKYRDFPEFAEKPFREMWKERQKRSQKK